MNWIFGHTWVLLMIDWILSQQCPSRKKKIWFLVIEHNYHHWLEKIDIFVDDSTTLAEKILKSIFTYICEIGDCLKSFFWRRHSLTCFKFFISRELIIHSITSCLYTSHLARVHGHYHYIKRTLVLKFRISLRILIHTWDDSYL